jgi:hypothetical protein
MLAAMTTKFIQSLKRKVQMARISTKDNTMTVKHNGTGKLA